MSEQECRIVLGYSDESLEWPEQVKMAFINFVESGYGQQFSVICAVGFNLKERELTIRFSPDAAGNERKAEMCEDLAEMFHAVAKRFSQ